MVISKLTVSPPRTGAPEEESSPHVAIVGEVLKTVLESLDTRGVACASNLAEDGLLAIGLEPRGCEVKALGTYSAADAGLVCSGTIGI